MKPQDYQKLMREQKKHLQRKHLKLLGDEEKSERLLAAKVKPEMIQSHEISIKAMKAELPFFLLLRGSCLMRSLGEHCNLLGFVFDSPIVVLFGLKSNSAINVNILVSPWFMVLGQNH